MTYRRLGPGPVCDGPTPSSLLVSEASLAGCSCAATRAAAGVSLVEGFGVGIADRVRRSCSMGQQPVLALSLRPSWGGTAD